MTQVRKQFITYEMYGEYVSILTDYLINLDHHFDIIIAPPLGALPIATHLMKHLDINEYIFDMDVYNDLLDCENELNILIVDDIIDTGDTMHVILDDIDEFSEFEYNKFTCSLFYKPHSKFKPDYYVKETSNWIVFPWEKSDEIPNREAYKHL